MDYSIAESNVSKDLCVNPSSIYYLHSSENPRTIFVNLQFKEKNYHYWSRNMRRAL